MAQRTGKGGGCQSGLGQHQIALHGCPHAEGAYPVAGSAVPQEALRSAALLVAPQQQGCTLDAITSSLVCPIGD